MCEQCASPGVTTPTEYGPLCDRCAFRQAIRDEQRATFAHLTPSTFGFDRRDRSVRQRHLRGTRRLDM